MNTIATLLIIFCLTSVLNCNAADCTSAALPDAEVPTGYCAFIYAQNIQSPRGIEVASNGDLLVIARGQKNRILVLWEDDNGNVQQKTLYNGNLNFNHGIKLHNDFLYASTDTGVYRFSYPPEKYRQSFDSDPTSVVVNIPCCGHSTRTLEFDEEGRLYVSIGSATNIDNDSSRSRVVRFNVTVVPQQWSSGEVFADGLRNEVGLRRDPRGRLWGVENGIDNLGVSDQTRKDFGDIHVNNPAEEVNLLLEENKHKHYGYPYCWSEGIPDSGVGVSFPQGQGAGVQWATQNSHPTYTDEWCKDPNNVVPPRYTLMAHSAPLDIYFYTGTTFLDSQGNSLANRIAFVSLHGSWNRPTNNPSGRAVVGLYLDSHGYPIDSSYFLKGPLNWGVRPVGLAVAPCKAYGECLFITDDNSHRIIALAYAPDHSSPTPTSPPVVPPPVELNEPRSIELAPGLELTYTLLEENKISISVTKQMISGWLFVGFNTDGGMLNTRGLITSGPNGVISTLYVNSFNATEILATANNTLPWDFTNVSSTYSGNSAVLSFTHEITGSDGINIPLNESIFVAVAWHGVSPANITGGYLPKHTGAGSFYINFATGTTGVVDAPPPPQLIPWSPASSHTLSFNVLIYVSLAFTLFMLLL